MTPSRFQQIRNVFEAALERGAGRGLFLTEACGGDAELRQEVDRLLDAHESTITMGPDSAVPISAARTDPASREGRRIGDYEVLRELGRGGMGSVFLARRADAAFQKNVAIKILRADVASTDVIQRFHREREILAQLDHPNIARLLDAGETDDGLPYFVMEYAEGRSITGYADDKRLSVRDRIELFRQVCDAVEYAHQRKIVHRDLKPGNVLVTAEGQVKLLDFGIARLLEQDAGMANLTRSGMWLMTPEYASPEQVRGETAGRASDVYSLGVILFELLTGHRPYHMKSRIFHEVVRIVCEEPPTKPSAVITESIDGRLRQTSLDELRRQLTGDIDNILLKALDKQPQERYASPQQLRADIDRHLNSQAVWARGDSWLYRTGRLLSRYRIALVGIGVLAAAVATGAANVRLLWWVGGGAALVGLWHAATDAKWGRKLAGAVPPSAFLIMSLLRPFTGDYNYLIGVGVASIGVAGLLRWALARRQAGSLMLRLGGVRRTILRIITCVMALASTLGALYLGGRFAYGWGMAIGASFLSFVGFSREIRAQGFVSFRLIRWSQIASWAWTPVSSWNPNRYLILHLHRRIQFLPPVKIPVPDAQQEQVEAILQRQLGEWPSTDKSNEPPLR